MSLRKVIREKIELLFELYAPSESQKICEGKKSYEKKILSESVAAKKTPKTFDHLKWKLDHDQKHMLQDLIDIHPDMLKDRDYEYVSNIVKIPVKSIKSIQNTYGSWNERVGDNLIDSTDSKSYGRFSSESKKILTAPEYNIPQKYRNDVVNFKPMSKEEADAIRYPKKTKKQKEYESILGNSIKGVVKKSNIKTEGHFNDWMMYYIIGEMKPKESRINETKKTIEVDFEPSEDYYDFHKSMLNSNKKSKYWIGAESLINQFNEIFGTNYTIDDQYDLVKSKSNCIRLVIKEIAYSDKMIWDSDSKSYIPWDYASESARKQYKNNQANNLVKPAPDVDFNDLLDKYLSFDSSMFQGL